jgi:hypothetical protein
MTDVVFVAVIIGFFALTIGLVYAFDQLLRRGV